MAFEADRLDVIGGLWRGLTTGGPVAIVIANSEWPKWQAVMSAEPGEVPDEARAAALTRPRPGHADLAGMMKYDVTDARVILERASARETAARVALGAVARAFLVEGFGISLVSHVTKLGPAEADPKMAPGPGDGPRVDASPVRTLDQTAEAAMIAAIDSARQQGDSLGGEIEVIAHGVPVGLGSHVQGDRRLDGNLAGAVMSIPAIKAVEIGAGRRLAGLPGSGAHDAIERRDGCLVRPTNRAGGIEGGISNGQPIIIRATMKPIPSLVRPLPSVDLATGQASQAMLQRSDVTAVPAAGVVAEAMVALVLAQAALDKFGGDSLAETRRNLAGYLAGLARVGQ
jgi:chorismate synthase